MAKRSWNTLAGSPLLSWRLLSLFRVEEFQELAEAQVIGNAPLWPTRRSWWSVLSKHSYAAKTGVQAGQHFLFVIWIRYPEYRLRANLRCEWGPKWHSSLETSLENLIVMWSIYGVFVFCWGFISRLISRNLPKSFPHALFADFFRVIPRIFTRLENILFLAVCLFFAV